MIRRLNIRLLARLVCLSGLGLGTGPLFASEAAPTPPARSASAPAGRPPLITDPLEHLRQKLAERLGAARAPESKNPNVLRVATPSDPKAAAAEARAAARTRSASRAKPLQPGAASAAEARVSEPPPIAPIPWAYSGPGGPEAWAQIAPDAAACASGKRQSPIDLRDTIAVNLEPLTFDYRASGFNVRDTGHSIEARWKETQTLTVNGRRYTLEQMHFHLPAEERVNGQGYAMSAHLVHRDEAGHLAVVAVLMELGEPQALVQAVWDALPLERGGSMASPLPADLSLLLPADPRYFAYMGSLTTPPCTEGVLWLVMKQPVSVSAEQRAIFARFHPMNARPIQESGDRLIKEGR